MDLLSFILGRGESSILNDSVRIKKELVLSISSYNYTPKGKGLFIVSGILKEENVKKAIDAILEEIDRVKEIGVSKEDLQIHGATRPRASASLTLSSASFAEDKEPMWS